MTASSWQKISSKKVYKNQYFQVREDEVVRPDGSPGKYFVIETTPSVMIVPVTNELEFYIVGQHRYTTDIFSWEVPGGSTDGEEIIAAAKRELQEETGLISDDWENLGVQQVLNGSTDKVFTILLAKNVTQTDKNKQASDGIVEMKKISFSKVLEMIGNLEISDAETISALMLAAIKLKLIGG
jgi:ADP-ribose pyrophosphatase YjhB (NUDIX family)